MNGEDKKWCVDELIDIASQINDDSKCLIVIYLRNDGKFTYISSGDNFEKIALLSLVKHQYEREELDDNS